LEDVGYAGSEALAGLVFLVIIGTVVVQSFTTPWAARLLGVQPMLTLIIGADPLGRALARHLTEQGEEVVLVDRDPDNVAAAREEELMAVQGDATQEAVLRKAGVERARALVATTSSDKTNLLVCRTASTRFGVDETVARVNDESALATFNEAGVRAMSPLSASVMVLDNLLRRPSTLKLLTDLDSGKEVREVQLRNGGLAGKALKDIRLDGDVLVAMVRRGGGLFVPHGATTLSADDVLTLIGTSDDVAAATALFERVHPAHPSPAAMITDKHRR
jgi:Trk K+ transport system NAD-binding subunit